MSEASGEGYRKQIQTTGEFSGAVKNDSGIAEIGANVENRQRRKISHKINAFVKGPEAAKKEADDAGERAMERVIGERAFQAGLADAEKLGLDKSKAEEKAKWYKSVAVYEFRKEQEMGLERRDAQKSE